MRPSSLILCRTDPGPGFREPRLWIDRRPLQRGHQEVASTEQIIGVRDLRPAAATPVRQWSAVSCPARHVSPKSLVDGLVASSDGVRCFWMYRVARVRIATDGPA